MCEALFFVVDRVHPDPYMDVQNFKRGDVIVVEPDGHVWGTDELSNPDWRILKLPNVSVLQAQSFLSEEVDTDPQKPSRMLQKRGFKLDVDAATLPAAVKTWLLDKTRAAPTFTVNFTPAQFITFKKKRDRRADPNIA